MFIICKRIAKELSKLQQRSNIHHFLLNTIEGVHYLPERQHV